MEDPRTADGVEHLQAAARELLLAARSFLNVVEEVVEDRDRFAGAASGVVDLLRDGLGGVVSATGSPLQPWERAAWQDGGATVHDPAERGSEDEVEDGPEPAGEPAAETDPEPAPKPTGAKRPAPASPPGRTRRVRRIAVD